MDSKVKRLLDELSVRKINLAQSVALNQTIQDWIHVMPVGRWEIFMGGGPGFGDPMEITAQMIAEMVVNFERYNQKILCDYEHDSIWGNTKASGWIVEVEKREDGLWGKVKWTPAAAKMITDGEYAYISPAWDFNYLDPKAGETVGARLRSIGLTNTPFFEQGLEQILAAKEQRIMDKLKLYAASLGMGDAVTEEQFTAELKFLKALKAEVSASLGGEATVETVKTRCGEFQSANQKLEAIRNELRVASSASAEEIIAAIKARGDDGTQLAVRVQELETEKAERIANQLVSEAQAAGKISAADLKWANEFARKDAEGFKTWIASAPTKVPVGAGSKPKIETGENGDPIPTEAELEVARATGTDAVAIAKQRVARESGAGK